MTHITRQTTIGDMVKQHPQAAEIVTSYGLHCVGCHVASWETLEQGAKGHGMPDEVIDEMIAEINEYIDELAQS